MLYRLSKATLLLCGAVLVAHLYGNSQDQTIRVIPYQEKTIQDQLRPDDQVVVIAREMGSVQQMEAAPSAEELLRYLAYLSDVIAVVEINDVSGVLVDGGSWINTRVVSTAKNVLSDRNRPLRVGSTLQFHFNGGEIAIGKVLVKAWDVPKMTVGRSYVVFVQVDPGDGRLFPRHVPALIDGDVLAIDLPLQTATGDKPDPLNGYPVQKLITEVHRLVEQ